jgi:putative heme-binding domain-containing protein
MSFNDWGEKFVCANSDHLQQVMFEDRYAARNPYFAAPSPRVSIAADGPQAEVFRASPVEPWRIVRTRLRTSGIVPGIVEGGGKPAGYFTGATGVTICRGDAFAASGERQLPESTSLHGYAIVGDVGSNLVHRKRLDGDGLPYIGRRIDEKSELIASTDIWFRPVQFANGPDGALYIADMYREVIEHPASLPPIIKKHLDLTSGRDRGRIYRLVPAGFTHPKLTKFSLLTTNALVVMLAHPNAWQRETAARLLYQRQDPAAIAPLRRLALRQEAPPLARSHALYALAGLQALSPEVLLPALRDAHPRLRQCAVRLSEALIDEAAIAEQLLQLVDDDDLRVRYQLAFTLGQLRGPRRDAALAKLAARNGNNAWSTLAIMSSVGQGAGGPLAAIAGDGELASTPVGEKFIALLAAQIGKSEQADDVAALLDIVARFSQGSAKERALAQLMVEEAQAKGALAEQVAAATGGRFDQWRAEQFQKARQQASNSELPVEERVAAAHRLGVGPTDEVREVAAKLISPEQPAAVQQAALAVLGRVEDNKVADLLIARWPQLGPAARGSAIEVLLTRDGSVVRLLAAIQSQQIAVSEIPASRLAVLAAHREASIRDAAKKLLDEKLARRGKLVADYQASLEKPGDAERGRAVFAKHCAACHQLGGVGHEIGPNLASAAGRGAEFILVNVLDPNREVNPQFVSYVAVTKEGRSASGILSAETATSITLLRGEKASDTLLRIDLDELKSTGMSLMPEGLEKEIDQAAMADLLTYLLQSGAAE